MKWHYFNEYDPNCYTEIWPHLTREKCFYTACGKAPENVNLHTENKRQVDCLKCLKRLNYKIKKDNDAKS